MPRSARPSTPLGALTHDRVAYSGLARSAAGVKVASALRMGDGPWPADADRLSHFAQVVVQLMIPPGQLVHLRLRDRQGIQAGMRRRGGLVLEPVEHMHRHAWWQPRAELARQLELVAGPAALADERSGDQHDRREPSLRRLLGERMDEDCRACRMAGHDRAVVQVRHLAPDRCAPPGITRVALVGHARVADLVPAPAAALDEQDLPGTCHGDPPSRLRDDPSRHPPPPESIPGGGKSGRRPRRASPRTSSIAARRGLRAVRGSSSALCRPPPRDPPAGASDHDQFARNVTIHESANPPTAARSGWRLLGLTCWGRAYRALCTAATGGLRVRRMHPIAGGPMPGGDEIRDVQRATWAGLSAGWEKWDSVI